MNGQCLFQKCIDSIRQEVIASRILLKNYMTKVYELEHGHKVHASKIHKILSNPFLLRTHEETRKLYQGATNR